MSKTLSLVGEVLQVEGFAVGEDGVTLSQDQALAIEAALADRDAKNAELSEQVEALKAAPAESSPSVVDSKNDGNKADAFNAFADTVNKAYQLSKLVP